MEDKVGEEFFCVVLNRRSMDCCGTDGVFVEGLVRLTRCAMTVNVARDYA